MMGSGLPAMYSVRTVVVISGVFGFSKHEARPDKRMSAIPDHERTFIMGIAERLVLDS
jgi:hypothetical protein